MQRLLTLFAFLIFLIATQIGPAIRLAHAGATVPLVVVVCKDNPTTNITLNELRQIFLRQRTEWTDGTPIQPINPSLGDPTRNAFAERVYGMTQAKEQEYWINQKIRGQKANPTEIASALTAQRFVQKNKGAISYVRANQLIGESKVLTVDGLGPNDPNYPLQMAP